MRVFLAAATMLLVCEAIIGFAFLGGYHWLGGGLGGLVVAGIAVVLLAAPWIGDIAVELDSAAGTSVIRLAWWGRIVQEMKPSPRLRIYVLGICVRRVVKKPGKPKPRRVARSKKLVRRGLWRWLCRSFETLAPMLLSSGHLLHALFWEARRIELTVQSPTQFRLADEMIAKIVGSPKLGKLQLRCLYPGEKRVVFRYRIGLSRAALAALVAIAQSRPRRLMRSMKDARRTWEAATVEVVPGTTCD